MEALIADEDNASAEDAITLKAILAAKMREGSSENHFGAQFATGTLIGASVSAIALYLFRKKLFGGENSHHDSFNKV